MLSDCTVCHECHQSVPSYDTIGYAGEGTTYQSLCSRCFNKIQAEAGGFNFAHVRFDPLEMADADGVTHLFHFRMQLLANGCHLGAVEVKEGQPRGYEFAVTGDPEGSPFALMAKLLARMQRGLGLRHLRHDEHGEPRLARRRVRGRITWDDANEGRVPLMVIDGREISWDDLGRMLMTFEGWQLKLEIHQRDREI